MQQLLEQTECNQITFSRVMSDCASFLRQKNHSIFFTVHGLGRMACSDSDLIAGLAAWWIGTSEGLSVCLYTTQDKEMRISMPQAEYEL
jgi:hypothetical protein